jgi:hypothetical protein
LPEGVLEQSGDLLIKLDLVVAGPLSHPVD